MVLSIEEQRIWRGMGFLRSISHKREFEETASIHDARRIKRQYQGDTMKGHYYDTFESRRKAELLSSLEAGRHFGELCAGIHGIADRDTWHRQYADYLRTDLIETPSRSFFAPPQFQNGMETSHFVSNDSMVEFTSSPLTSNGGSSRPHNKKFLFDGATSSVGSFCFGASSTQTNMIRFTRRFGSSRVDPVISACACPVCDGSLYSSYTDEMLQPLNAEPLCLLQNEVSNAYGARHSFNTWTLPFLMWRSRRELENDCLLESARNVNSGSPNNSISSQTSGMSSASTMLGSRTFQGESTIHPSFINTIRDSYSGFPMGIHTRRYRSGEGPHWTGIASNCRMQNSLEHLSRLDRRLPFRESASGASQLVSPDAFAASGSLIYGPQAVFPVHGPRIPSFSSEGESGRPSARPTQSGMPRRRRRERVIRSREALSHESLNQSLEYEEADIDDQQMDMGLDVDAMSYEELLVLGERIGNVKTGLSADSIQKCVKMSKHSASSVFASVASQKNEILCTICQEEYRENDELGQLVCGHIYHPPCIKQWLGLKNQCPICKAAAYSEC